MARARRNIQIVEADGNRSGDAQARRFREQIFVHFFGKQANERVFRRHTLEQFFAWDVIRGGPVFGIEVLVENFSRRFEEAVGHKDFGARHATLRRSAGIPRCGISLHELGANAPRKRKRRRASALTPLRARDYSDRRICVSLLRKSAAIFCARSSACSAATPCFPRPRIFCFTNTTAPSKKARPQCVVFPRSTEDVLGIVRLANQYKSPMVGRGAGTGLSGGALAREGGVLIVFSRMNRILEIDVENRRAVVQPGVVNLELSRAVEQSRLYFAPDPSSQKACTIGGNVSENAGGPHTLAYGVTTNHVLG